MQTHEEYRNEVKARYRFSDWAGQVKGDRATTRRDVRLPEPLVDEWTAQRVDSISEGMEGVSGANRYLYEQVHAPQQQRVMVRLYEYDSPLAAHEGLIDIVMTHMAPTLPPCESVATEAGDYVFWLDQKAERFERVEYPTGALLANTPNQSTSARACSLDAHPKSPVGPTR